MGGASGVAGGQLPPCHPAGAAHASVLMIMTQELHLHRLDLSSLSCVARNLQQRVEWGMG